MKKSMKKILSALCVLATLLTSLSVGLVLAGAGTVSSTTPVWSGDYASAYADGSGDGTTAAKAILIENGEQLALMLKSDSDSNGKYFKLTADIYLNDVSNPNWRNNAPKNWMDKATGDFGAHLDGDGHTVYGLYAVGETVVGLIPATIWGSYTVEVKNLSVRDSYVASTRTTQWDASAGALIGMIKGGGATVTVENCFVAEDVTVTGNDYGVGGVVGTANTSSGTTAAIRNCCSLAQVSSNGAAGAIFGSMTDGNHNLTIEKCYGTNPSDTSLPPVGARWEDPYTPICSDVYGTAAEPNWYITAGITVVELSEMRGATAAEKMPGLFGTGFLWKTTDNWALPTLFANSASGKLEIWDGTATAITEGDGSPENPYEISNGGQLYLVVTAGAAATAGNHYELTADIYLNSVATANWYEGENLNNWPASAWPDYPKFAGTLNGNGHVVYGLYSDQAERIGLFPATAGNATIMNLGVDKAYLYQNSADSYPYTGIFVGHVDWDNDASLTLQQCYAGADVTVKGTNTNGAGLGGLVGYVYGTKASLLMEDCYSLAKITAAGRDYNVNTGLLVGTLDAMDDSRVTVRRCYAITDSDISLFALANMNDKTWANVSAVYSNSGAGNIHLYHKLNLGAKVTVLDRTAMAGLGAADSLTELNFTTTWQAKDGEYPSLRVFGSTGEEDTPATGFWDGKAAKSYGGGTGASDNPFLISNAAQLALLAQENTKNWTYSVRKYFKLTADIYLNDVSAADWMEKTPQAWPGIPDFGGVLDGDGHTVYGVYMRTDESECGFIQYTKWDAANGNEPDIVVKNLGIANSYFESTYDPGYSSSVGLGAIIGSVHGTPHTLTLENCYVSPDVVVRGKIDGVGGMVGWISDQTRGIRFRNCYSLAQVFTGNGKHHGALMGGYYNYDYNNLGGSIVIEDCYGVVTNNTDAPVIGGSNGSGAEKFTCRDVYGTATTNVSEGITVLTLDSMQQGTLAAFGGLDFDNDWKASVGFFWPTLRKTPAAAFAGGELSVAGGSGTQADPYRIETLSQLHQLRSVIGLMTWGQYFRLENDIDADGALWELAPSVFSGHFDGNGKRIRNLTVKNDTAALFGMLSAGAVVENLGVESCVFQGKTAAAIATGVVGDRATVRFCYADETVEVQGTEYCGGLIGSVEAELFTLNSCYFTGKLSNSSKAKPSGLMASVQKVNNRKRLTVSNCYVATQAGDYLVPYESFGHYGQLVRVLNSYSTKQQEYNLRQENGEYFADAESYERDGLVYTIGDLYTVARADMLGEKAKASMPQLDFSVYTTVDGKTPRLRVFCGGLEENAGLKGAVWTGAVALHYAGGNGTKENPYCIETAEQLAKLVRTSLEQPFLTEGNYYKLTADIYLNDVTDDQWYKKDGLHNWFADIRHLNFGFLGHFDGDYHTVHGVYYNFDPQDQRFDVGDWHAYGLFPTLARGAVVENVAVSHFYATCGRGDSGLGVVGCVVGIVSEYEGLSSSAAVIRRCVVTKSCILEGNVTGGIVSMNLGALELTDCVSSSQGANRWGRGTLVGSLVKNQPLVLKNCLSLDVGRQKCFYYTDFDEANWTIENIYTTYSSDKATVVALSQIQGENAKKVLTGLFAGDSVWTTVDNAAPVPAGFERVAVPNKLVTITLDTGANGVELPPLVGYAGSQVNWPAKNQIKNGGNEFVGWYLEDFYLREYTDDVFPEYDIVLFARWIEKNVEQSFEAYPYGVAGVGGLGADYERYRPGVAGYQMSRTHDGLAGIHRIGASSAESDFQIFQPDWNGLENNRKYELSFWIYPETVADTEAYLRVVFTDYLEVDQPIYGVKNLCKLGALKVGEWQKVTFTVTALTDYLAIRTPGRCSLYLDELLLFPTDEWDGAPVIPNDGMPEADAGVADEPAFDTTTEGGEDNTAGGDDSTTGDSSSENVTMRVTKIVYKKNNTKANNGLDTAAVIAIAVGAAVVFGGGGTGLALFLRKRKLGLMKTKDSAE